MEKKDKITLVIFIFLVVSIIFVVGINSYRNRKLENVDRKIEYILGYTYDSIQNKGETLFLQTVEFFINNDVFEYEQNLEGTISYFAINGINNYKKIKNFSIAKNNFTSASLKEYMDYKKIIIADDSYFIENEKMEKNNYIGSMIYIDSYNDSEVYFKSKNYYCNDSEYEGVIVEEPKCEYTYNESGFSIKLENNIFKISNLENFKLIVQ